MKVLTQREIREQADDAAMRVHAQLAYRKVKPGGYAAWGTSSGTRAWVMDRDRKVLFEPYGTFVIVSEHRLEAKQNTSGGVTRSWVRTASSTFDLVSLRDPRTSVTVGGLSEAIHYFAACAASIQEKA